MLNFFGLMNLAIGILAAIAGVVVFRGVFRRSLSAASAVRFLKWSLFAGVAGLMPLSRHLAPLQQICMVSVYCSGAAIVAWLKFGLVGRSRSIFALSLTSVLYFDIVSVFTQLFRTPSLSTMRLMQPQPFFQFVQFLFAAAFIVLGVLAMRKFRIEPDRMSVLGKFRHT